MSPPSLRPRSPRVCLGSELSPCSPKTLSPHPSHCVTVSRVSPLPSETSLSPPLPPAPSSLNSVPHSPPPFQCLPLPHPLSQRGSPPWGLPPPSSSISVLFGPSSHPQAPFLPHQPDHLSSQPQSGLPKMSPRSLPAQGTTQGSLPLPTSQVLAPASPSPLWHTFPEFFSFFFFFKYHYDFMYFNIFDLQLFLMFKSSHLWPAGVLSS